MSGTEGPATAAGGSPTSTGALEYAVARFLIFIIDKLLKFSKKGTIQLSGPFFTVNFRAQILF